MTSINKLWSRQEADGVGLATYFGAPVLKASALEGSALYVPSGWWRILCLPQHFD